MHDNGGDVDQSYDWALAWLAERPVGTMLRWEAGKDFRPQQPFTTGSTDVGQPDLQAENRWGWVWDVWPVSVEAPDDSPFFIPLAYDATLAMRFPAGSGDVLPQWVRLHLDDGTVEDYTGSIEEIGDADHWAWWRANGEPYDDGDFDVVCVRVWTPMGVTRGLEAWAHEHLGRDDLRFVWDPALPNAVVDFLREAAEAVEDGRLPTPHEIVPGMFATDQVRDYLVENPESAERILDALRELREPRRPDDPGRGEEDP